MQEQELAYCGLSCVSCPIFIATANDDDELRRKTAQEWSKIYKEILGTLGMDEPKPEDMNCRGCKSESDHFKGCTSCPIRKCCREKSLTTCAGCSDYEACDTLNGFYSIIQHRQAKDNLDRIRMRR